MRFYTGKLEGTQLLFAGFEKDPFLYRIEDYGMKFSDMTELVCTITDEQKDRLLNEREGKRARGSFSCRRWASSMPLLSGIQISSRAMWGR